MIEQTLWETRPALSPTQQEVVEALRWLVVSGDTHDIQKVLREHGIFRERNTLAKRLGEAEALGYVERVGRNFARKRQPTTWRRIP